MRSSVQGNLRRLNASRRNVWQSISSTWLLPTFKGRYGTILCRFTGDTEQREPAADGGGPRRELFTLLATAIIKDSAVFTTGMPSQGRLSDWPRSDCLMGLGALLLIYTK